MSKHPVDGMTTAALRDLDPARRTDLTQAERQRADATYARIVATPTDAPVPIDLDRPRRRSRMLVPVGLVGAAGAAIPALLLGGSAYGSWTPTPEPLASGAASAAADTCRAALDVSGRATPELVAERRGDWTYVLLGGPGGEGSCLMPNDVVGDTVPGDRQAFFGTYDPDRDVEDPTLPSDGLVEVQSMEGTTDEGWFAWTQGHVGSDVTGVTVHIPSGPDVQASVDDGRFAAWWPVDDPGRSPAWSYTVTLADGSTRPAGG